MVKYESAFTDYQPFREPQIKSWKEVNKEVADNPSMGHNMSAMNASGNTMPGMDPPGGAKTPGVPASHDMGAMKTMPGKTMPGMDTQNAGAPGVKEGAGGHDMGAMKQMQRKAMPGVDKKTASAPKGKGGPAPHDMAAMKGSNETMAMAHPESKSGQPAPAGAVISGIGVVQGIDKTNGKIKLTHDPVAALGWPKMTMFFRLKDPALAEQLNVGDKIEFSLEKSASGFVISTLHKASARNELR